MHWQVLEADEFFTIQKSVTSDHTLNRLQQPRLAEEQLHQLLGDMTLSHKEAMYNLCADHTQFFTKWMFALRFEGIHFSCYVTKFQVMCNLTFW
jgi:origin recognition complex subunit 2